MTKIGYLRVSTRDQKPDRQIDGLSEICDELHIEYVSAVSRSRPVYDQVIARLEAGDTLVVWDLDRAFRSTIDAVREAEALRTRGVNFRIISLDVDTTTADGMLLYTVVAAIGQHERTRISERTKQGLEAARKRGKKLGRRSKLSSDQLTDIRQRLTAPGTTLKAIAAEIGMTPWGLSRALKRGA